jgi:hypothetical protein
MKFFYILLLGMIVWQSVTGQKKDSTLRSTVDGIVWDSAHSYALQSATVAVYRSADSALLGYRLSDVVGEFHFTGLPVGIPLRIVISFTGYKSFLRSFTISSASRSISLNHLSLQRSEGTLEEAVVSAVPPVRMNGDTLEFNPAAFALDSNAVVEDLLRKLPGVTVWGDGTITVNGKQVSSVLVEGKPFFGGDAKVALQNIPKGSVDRVQVYQRNKNPNNMLDSTTEINIKLRQDSKRGYFGKLGAGAGTRGYYEADASLNGYTPKTQLGLVAAANNINKVAGDVNTLLRNSTFKGVSANIDYQPDFTVQGINHTKAGGFTFEHDFEAPRFDKTNSLTANYFAGNNDLTRINHSQTTTFLNGDSSIAQRSSSTTRNSDIGQDLNIRYDKKKDLSTFYVSSRLQSDVNHYSDTQLDSVSTSSKQTQSADQSDQHDSIDSKSIEAEAGWNHRKAPGNNSRLPEDFDLNYAVVLGSATENKSNHTIFMSDTDPSQDMKFNRTYLDNTSTASHHLIAALGDFIPWIVGNYRLHNLSMKFQNDLEFKQKNEKDDVKDLDSATGYYLPNNYLTNHSRYVTWNDLPSIDLNRRTQHSLVNRYDQSLAVDLHVQWQLYDMKNSSTHSFQDIERRYNTFVPNASVTYDNNQYGAYIDKYTLSYITVSEHPNISQLAPLVDSTDPYFIQPGNIHLKPDYKQELSFRFTHSSLHSRNIFNYDIALSAGYIQNNLSDSSVSDSLGRTTRYVVNINGYQYLNAKGILNKAFKLNGHELQVNFKNSMNVARSPGYINSILNISHQFSNESVIGIFYALDDRISLQASERLSVFSSRQVNKESSTRFQNSILGTVFSSTVKCTNRLSIGSNITYNRNASTGAAVTGYTIWNANAAYRLLKGNNLEMKFSALDLLHQNTGIVNYGANNVLTRGTVNVLEQYFMLTLSYFPRRFGKKKG